MLEVWALHKFNLVYWCKTNISKKLFPKLGILYKTEEEENIQSKDPLKRAAPYVFLFLLGSTDIQNYSN